MAKARQVFLNLLLAFIFIGAGASMWMRAEYWPFSHYPMYARLSNHQAHWIVLEAKILRPAQEPQVIQLNRRRLLLPFTTQEYSELVMRLMAMGRNDVVLELTQSILKQFAERRRLAGDNLQVESYRIIMNSAKFSFDSDAVKAEKTLFEDRLL